MPQAASFAFPFGAAARDPAARLASLRSLAWLLDAALRVPGTRFRFGLNGLIGLAPGVGDALMALFSLYIVLEGYRLGLPRVLVARMLANVAIEATAGAVPVIGDLFDVSFKANLRNLAVIESYLRRR